jgi:hypothetical protein
MPPWSSNTAAASFSSDGGDEVSGAGSAELQDDGTVEIELPFDNGDDVTLEACRE